MIGIALPQHGHDVPFRREQLVEFAARAEAAGFSHLWTSDAIFSRGAFLEPLQLLSFAAARTTTIRLGVAALVMGRRNPLQLAHAAVTLDHLSDGRLDLALAAGRPPVVAGFLDPRRRDRQLEEAIELMRSLWDGKPLDAAGELAPLKGKTLNPTPVQRPFPLWLAGTSDRALARAARWGTGWIGPGEQSLDAYTATVRRLRATLEQAGREVSSFPLGKRAYIAIDQPQESIVRWFAATYGSADAAERAAAATITGDVDEIFACLQELRSAGAQLLILNPVADELAQFEAVAGELLPRLRASAGR
jgi:alkanesulfonate monooxygenase SsuD/methylene tetrahydromethanopterin reductase-like flavin-dependent oxidoreductase (luciferase family)